MMTRKEVGKSDAPPSQPAGCGRTPCAGVLPPRKEFCMNLIISGHHLEITPALRSYVQDKLASIARHFDHALDVKVLLSVETPKGKVGQQKAECNIRMKGQDLFAHSQHTNMYAAIDELISKLDRLVEKYKQKTKASHAVPTGQMPA
jgi:putative sigma-54 modulation protein